LAYGEEQMYRLNGIVTEVVFASKESGFAVIELLAEGDTVTAVGELAGIAPGEELTMQGSWAEHASFGRQFRVSEFSCRLPDTQANILMYLSSGIISGVGPATARHIVEAFGEKSLEVLQAEPAKLAQRVKGITSAKAKQISKDFCVLMGLRQSVEQMGHWGINANVAMAAFRRYGPGVEDQVRQNPYLLCDAPVNLPFTQADDTAARLGLDPESDFRRRAGLVYVLKHNLNNGHTCLPQDKMLAAAGKFLYTPPEQLETVLAQMNQEGALARVQQGQDMVYLPEYYRAEQYAARRLAQMVKAPPPRISGLEMSLDRRQIVTGVKYAPLQRKAVFGALQHNVSVLTGGPGTGKTTTVNAILALMEERQTRVSLAAPTGRAAKRLAELTGHRATTIHRLLEVDPKAGTEQLQFIHDENNPLRTDVVIVDEMSMVDALLFESLLRALRPGCRLVLVGDANQLPSVGAGNVLRSVIDSGTMPVVCLTEIFRQAAQSLIVSNAHRIVAGEMPASGAKTDDFFFLQTDGVTGPGLLADLVSRRLPDSYGFSPIRDIQVLCATRIGPLGTEALNKQLQQLLNPPSANKNQLENRGTLWREGDKVMQIRNNYDIEWRRDDGEEGTGAFNGDIGRIELINRRAASMQVRFDDKVYVYEGEALGQLELAYAVTVHKSQGSEFEAVILPVAEIPAKLCYRNLLYTGVTRAKRLLILLGQPTVLTAMVQNDRRILRYSCFTAMLREQLPQFQPEVTWQLQMSEKGPKAEEIQ